MALTLFDLLTLQRNDQFTGLIEDVTTYAPEFSQFPVTRRAGTYYEIASRTALPASQFRAINSGTTPTKSAFKKTLKEMFFLDTIIDVDEAIYKGDDRSTGDILSHEAQGALQASIITIGAQIWYGTANSTYGFGGIRSQLSGTTQAGGSTNSTSAYLLWFNEWGVSLDVGKDGDIAMKPWTMQQISSTDVSSTGSSTQKLFAWVSNISCYIGLSVKSQYSVWAVTGISGSGVTNKWTDTLGFQLLALIPLNRRQGLTWFVNRQGFMTLQVNRTVTLFGQGTTIPSQGLVAAAPIDCAGFPIVQTDSITNTESN